MQRHYQLKWETLPLRLRCLRPVDLIETLVILETHILSFLDGFNKRSLVLLSGNCHIGKFGTVITWLQKPVGLINSGFIKRILLYSIFRTP